MRETPFTEHSIIEYNTTVLHPLILLILVAAVALIWILPRRRVLIPVFMAGILVPMQQSISIAGLDFRILRILILAALARLLLTGEGNRTHAVNTDRWIVAWMLVATVTYTLLWLSSGALINRAGMAIDVLGLYFLVRCYVRDLGDYVRVVKVFAVIACIVAVAMFIEHVQQQNVFAMFGGLPTRVLERSERYRCQGPFMHPILAGMFGGVMFPLFWGVAKQKYMSITMAVVACVASIMIVYTSASSGAVLALVTGIVALLFWRWRRYMREIRWLILFTLIGLHLVMKAPVWALVARIAVVGGSTGNHRFVLMDNFIRRFGEWWLVGVESTMHWGHMMYDITNQFVRVGIDGGFLSLVLFIGLIASGFRSAGMVISRNKDDRDLQFITWTMAACLLGQVISFFGVSFFDQIIVVLYGMLAMLASLRETTAEYVVTEVEPIYEDASGLNLAESQA